MPVIQLDQDYIEAHLQCPQDKKRIEYCDQNMPGLYIEVRISNQGQGTYYLRYKDNMGKTCHKKIGRTTDIDLDEARKQAKVLKSDIAAGSDPKQVANIEKAVPTLTQFIQEQYLPYAKQMKKTWWKDRDMFDFRLKDQFGNKRIDQITRHQIQSFHTGLKEEGLAAATANHYVKMLRHALNLAVDWELLEKNPAARVPLFREDNQVEHYLDDDQLEKLLTVLRTDENRTVCLIAMFLLSTGARLNEALQAKWKHFDRSHRMWHIPASNSKSKKVRSVPLNDSALGILDQLDTEGKFEHLFINRKTGKTYTTIQKVWNRLRKAAGLPHLRIHDLRHQYASFLVNSGRTLYEVQQILGHSDPMVTQRYAHLSTKALQDAANSASDIIMGASDGEP